MSQHRLLLLLPCFFICLLCQAQQDSLSNTTTKSPIVNLTKSIVKEDSLVNTLQHFPERFVTNVSDKVSGIDAKLSKQTLKALKYFKKQENKLNRKLAAKDSLAAKNVFAYGNQKLNQLEDQFKQTPDKALKKLGGEYNAYVDTLKSTFKFLKANGSKVSGYTDAAKIKLESATGKLNILEEKFQKAEEIKKYLRERKDYLKQQLQKFGMVKQLKKIEKTSYYYAAYVKEYKTILKDRKKLEQKAMAMLYKTAIFKKFFSQNSLLAGLFKIPGATTTGETGLPTLAGIQTRENVQDLIRNNIAAGGPNAMAAIQQKIQYAKGELAKLKDKINQYGSADADIPSFKPNSQKMKSFLQRLEYGANIQFGKRNQFMPTTSDIALSLGYKVNDKSSVGIGASYKIGFGSGWNNVKLSNEGVGLRSYLDWKLKGNLFVIGGYEQNYNSQFKNIQQLKSYSSWQSSALLGLSKKLKLKGTKSSKIQLLYDFLSTTHIPHTNVFIYRIAYTLK